jgi:hemerythrin-like domain-containing protein
MILFLTERKLQKLQHAMCYRTGVLKAEKISGEVSEVPVLKYSDRACSATTEDRTMKSTSVLQEDHKYLLRSLNILAEIASRVEASQGVNQKDMEILLDFLKGFGDRHHQGKEESVLFPALLRDREQKNYHKLCSLIFEHNRERSLVRGLRDSLLTKNTRELVYYAQRLNEILRAHIKEEEEVLFPLVDSSRR